MASVVAGSWIFMRIAACGHTSAQRAQSMQISGSQIGISAASVRFSTRAVPVGNVPSTGRALTGSRSPSPASMRAVTRCTKSDASGGTGDRRPRVAVTATGCDEWAQRGRRRVDRGEVGVDDRTASLAVRLRTEARMASSATSSGNRLVSAKQHTCITTLI